MFDYFGVLVSVMLGMALTHLLKGLAKLVQTRHESSIYWVHIVWTLNVFIFVLAIWWGMFWWRGLQDWTVEWFFFISIYATALYLWASLLYPPDFPRGFAFENWFFDNKHWFFGAQTLVLLLDIPETFEKSVLGLRPVPRQYELLMPVLLLIAVTGFFSNSRRVHAGLAVSWLIATLSYLFLNPSSQIMQH